MNSGSDKGQNIKRALYWIERAVAEKAKFILLPEVFNFRGRILSQHDLNLIAEDIPGESTRAVMSVARKHKVYVLAGSIYEKRKGGSKAYNTSVLINAEGQIVAKYRKMNLFDAVVDGTPIQESATFVRGRKTVVASVEDFKAGLSICFDLRFPELYRKYAQAGVHILSIPSSFTYVTGEAHWEPLLRARAIENLCYVLAPNQIGKDGRGVRSYGNSMIISPWGKILARASEDQEEVICAQIAMAEVEQTGKIFSLANG